MASLTRTLRFMFISGSSRPIFSFVANGSEEVVAMYDSGAITPVWAKNERMLRSLFPLVEKQTRSCLLSGFGMGAVVCSVYKITELSFENEGERYVIRNLPIVVNENPSIGCDMVLSATMFSHADVMIKQREGKSITIYFDKETYFSAPLWSNGHMSIATWTQFGGASS